jgi:DNA-directed RNA polymerase specialized sigma24 family protein
MFTPLALEIHRRYMDGESIQELSTELGISVERIEFRIRAAEAYLARQEKVAA